MMLNNKYYKFFLIFASVFLGLSLLNLPDVLGIDISKGQWDSITRLRVAIHDLEPSHKYITGTTWLPLHFYVIRFLYFIFGNLNTVLLMHYFFLITGISFIISLLHKKEDSISKLCILIFSSIILLNTPVLFYLSLTAHSEPLFFFILSLSPILNPF